MRGINNSIVKAFGGAIIKASFTEIQREIESGVTDEEAEQAGNEQAEKIISNIQNKLSRLQGGEC